MGPSLLKKKCIFLWDKIKILSLFNRWWAIIGFQATVIPDLQTVNENLHTSVWLTATNYPYNAYSIQLNSLNRVKIQSGHNNKNLKLIINLQ